MQQEKIGEKIVLITFDSQEDMCKTLLRFQEHYESPKFRDKIFTLGEYKKWYSQEFGGFDYYSLVDGCNIPMTYLQPFIEGDFDPLSEEEKEFILRYGDLPLDWYLIAVYPGSDETTKDHEICHGLYATNNEYRDSVNKLLKKHNLKSVYKILKEKGYGKDVLLDEAHAFLCCNATYLKDRGVKFDKHLPSKLLYLKEKALG